jgi:hypothetical protein
MRRARSDRRDGFKGGHFAAASAASDDLALLQAG